MLGPAAQYQASVTDEDDTDLEFENVGEDDRHSLVNFSDRLDYSSCGQKS